MKVLLFALTLSLVAANVNAQTDSITIDTGSNLVSDSAAHHQSKSNQIGKNSNGVSQDQKINSPVPAQAPGTEVLITPTQKAQTGTKPAPATAPADVKTIPASSPASETKPVRPHDAKQDSALYNKNVTPSSETRPVKPQPETRPVKPAPETRPVNKKDSVKRSDKKDMYLVPDSAVKKIK